MALSKALNDTEITYWVLESATVYLSQNRVVLNYFGYADEAAYNAEEENFILTRCIEVALSEFSGSQSEMNAYSYDLLSAALDAENGE